MCMKCGRSDKSELNFESHFKFERCIIGGVIVSRKQKYKKSKREFLTRLIAVFFWNRILWGILISAFINLAAYSPITTLLCGVISGWGSNPHGSIRNTQKRMVDRTVIGFRLVRCRIGNSSDVTR